MSPLVRAARSVVESLEDRRMFAVDIPYAIEWTGSEVRNGVVDASSNKTGFEFVNSATTGVTAYDASKLAVDTGAGVLRVTTSAGSPQDNQNTLVNNLVNEFNGLTSEFTVTTRIEGLNSVTSAAGRQAGLWFGPDQDNYVKLVVLSTPNGPRVQFLDERAVGAITVHTATTAESQVALPADAADLELRLIGTTDENTGAATLRAEYRTSDSAPWTAVSKQYSFTGALKNRFFNSTSRTGLIAAHRASSSAAVVSFDNFAITGPAPEARVTADKATAYFNNALNNTTQPSQTITITNTGTGVVTLGSATITGDHAGLYTITSGALPATLAVGASTNVQVAFRPTGSDNVASRGLKVAQLQVASDAANLPNLKVDLRGLATSPNTSAEDFEPSLQRILDLYQIPVQTGDIDPDDAELYDDEEPLSNVNDEVAAARLVKAGNGPVTISPLGAFALPDNVSVRLGYYASGTPTERTALGVVRGADARSVNVTIDGATAFDPGTSVFSLFGTFPGNAAPATHFTNDDGGGTSFTAGGSPRDVFAEDQHNTWDATTQRKIRFYPLKNADGTTVPNAYVFAMEEYTSDYDSNDFVGIIRNVTIAPSTPEIGVVAPDGSMIMPNALSFNRIETPGSAVTHDRTTVKIVNTGSAPLNISKVTKTGNYTATLAGGVSSATVPVGGSIDLEIVFTATFGESAQPGTVTITSNDPDEPSKVLNLTGMWMSKPEGNFERKLQTVVASLGFGTITGETSDLDTNGLPTAVKDEVVSPYWHSADGGEVVVRQMAAFHTMGQQTTIRWFTQRGTGGSQAAAPAPSGLLAVSNTSNPVGNNMVLTWTDNTNNETGFTIQRSVNGGAFTDLATVGINTTTYTDGGLNGGTEYAYRVRANRSGPDGGDTGYSNTAQGGSVVTHIGSDAQSFFPRRADAPTGYQGVGFFQPDAPFGLRLDKENSDDSLNTAAGGDATATPHRVRFFPAKTPAGVVIPNTYIVVMDFDGINYDFNDNVYLVSNIAPANNAAAPTGIAAVGDPEDGVRIDWADNIESGLVGYNVYRSTDGATFDKLNATPLSSSDYVDSTAVTGTAYTYRVFAIGGTGESQPTTITGTRPAAPATTAPAPYNLTAVVQSATQALIKWNDVAGENQYLVERSLNGTSWIALGTTAQDVTELTVNKLQPATTYFFRVISVNAAGQSVASNVVSITTDVA